MMSREAARDSLLLHMAACIMSLMVNGSDTTEDREMRKKLAINLSHSIDDLLNAGSGGLR